MFTLKPRSLDWALSHTLTYGDTDLYPVPVEYRAIEKAWAGVKEYLSETDVRQWSIRPYRQYLVPKGKFTYRPAFQLDPLDHLVLAASVYEAGKDIESVRVPSAENVVFSNRFAANKSGRMFNRAYNWSAFQTQCAENADNGRSNFVVVPDVADFFPRIYHHRIDNSLKDAIPDGNLAQAVFHLIEQFGDGKSYGIPIGSTASRLIAELAITDVDASLSADSVRYCRFSDDFRLFCDSLEDAYSQLESLAGFLYESHGFTLSPAKTRIISADEFLNRHVKTYQDSELQRLLEQYGKLAESLGLEDPYDPIEYEDLEPDDQALVDTLNLQEILVEQLSRDEIDHGVIRFVLRRLAQLGWNVVDELFENTDKWYTVTDCVAAYFVSLGRDNSDWQIEIGTRLADLLLSNPLISSLDSHRLWLLSVFTTGDNWIDSNRLRKLEERFGDEIAVRELTLVRGLQSAVFHFRRRRSHWASMEPWVKRAFIAGASCLPNDERRHWYKSISPRCDVLEKAMQQDLRELVSKDV